MAVRRTERGQLVALIRRGVALAAAVVACTLVAAGCGADGHLQRQESAARARYCDSRIERAEHEPPPHISANHWLKEVQRKPSLKGPANQSEIVRECQRIQADQASP